VACLKACPDTDLLLNLHHYPVSIGVRGRGGI
jgi:hypothetical protein